MFIAIVSILEMVDKSHFERLTHWHGVGHPVDNEIPHKTQIQKLMVVTKVQKP
jgi:hypothetical protein